MRRWLVLTASVCFVQADAARAEEPPNAGPNRPAIRSNAETQSSPTGGVPLWPGASATPRVGFFARSPQGTAELIDQRMVRPGLAPGFSPGHPAGSIRGLVADYRLRARPLASQPRRIEDVLRLEVEYCPQKKILVDDILFFRLTFRNVSGEDIYVTNLPLPAIAPLEGAIGSRDPADFRPMVRLEWTGGYSTPTRPTYFRPGETFTIRAPRLSVPIDGEISGKLYFRSRFCPAIEDANRANLFSESPALCSEIYELEIAPRPREEQELLRPWARIDEVRGCSLDKSGWPTRLQPEEFMAIVPYGCDTLEKLHRLETALSPGTCRDAISLYRRLRALQESPAQAASQTETLIVWLKTLPDVERQTFLDLIHARCLAWPRLNNEEQAGLWKTLGEAISREFTSFGENPAFSDSHRKPLPESAPPAYREHYPEY